MSPKQALLVLLPGPSARPPPAARPGAVVLTAVAHAAPALRVARSQETWVLNHLGDTLMFCHSSQPEAGSKFHSLPFEDGQA